ncbi:MAG: hypothetical protein COW18_03380 [Zetaproteobacteria bacterium CG12_big_fil_rev_8_21_14_0_65_54_13]|nr:MAG: hypothetical protein COX55_04765 [Zetaproteobacteria bacterium CG23_combo_of_CG06-09_8_20_14_all_54_7]PIW50615.1 MAG: hypothetical protein COW18_03380 [Zetaproteobacteria bacterium CG12_big_fil_rev_8_21_14_0_65_54_13]PIX54453.1 MAG: hypothetical protein COZ50_08005 [Zetaproteobacteria bacterium CG_4_10_14_3_um_filter_54_28]PJA28855.1 MAG: hypothetical protein CO188_08230 [Zetaproteobacteria bacterium CG_4_9_14_3_um_filter_54_145]
MSAEALRLFNTLSADVQRQAVALSETVSEDEAVYLAALRSMPEKERRQFLFKLSGQKWGL